MAAIHIVSKQVELAHLTDHSTLRFDWPVLQNRETGYPIQVPLEEVPATVEDERQQFTL